MHVTFCQLCLNANSFLSEYLCRHSAVIWVLSSREPLFVGKHTSIPLQNYHQNNPARTHPPIIKLTTITTSTLALATATNALPRVSPFTKTEDIETDPEHPDQNLQLPTITDEWISKEGIPIEDLEPIWVKDIPRKLGCPFAEAPEKEKITKFEDMPRMTTWEKIDIFGGLLEGGGKGVSGGLFWGDMVW